jgi:hypothetical protein
VLPHLAGVEAAQILAEGDGCVWTLRRDAWVRARVAGQFSAVHSRYQRRLADAPVGGRPVGHRCIGGISCGNAAAHPWCWGKGVPYAPYDEIPAEASHLGHPRTRATAIADWEVALLRPSASHAVCYTDDHANYRRLMQGIEGALIGRRVRIDGLVGACTKLNACR